MTTTPTTPSARHARPSAAPGPVARRVGYAVAILVNAVILYLLNRSPGWDAVPFLTDRTPEVLGLVNASIIVSIVANVVYLVRDPVSVRAAGDIVTTGVGLAALVRIWQVWPVDLTSGWDLLARVLVAIGVVGSLIGIVAAFVRLTRWFSESPSSPEGPHPSSGTTRHA